MDALSKLLGQKQNLKKVSTFLLILNVFFFTFLSSNVFGMFIFSIGLHYFSEPLLGVEAYSASELLAFVDQLDKDYKIAVVSSLVTVIGSSLHIAILDLR